MASTRRAYAVLALAAAADRVLGRAALGVLLMHAFGYDAPLRERWAGAEASVMPAASLPRRR